MSLLPCMSCRDTILLCCLFWLMDWRHLPKHNCQFIGLHNCRAREELNMDMKMSAAPTSCIVAGLKLSHACEPAQEWMARKGGWCCSEQKGSSGIGNRGFLDGVVLNPFKVWRLRLISLEYRERRAEFLISTNYLLKTNGQANGAVGCCLCLTAFNCDMLHWPPQGTWQNAYLYTEAVLYWFVPLPVMALTLRRYSLCALW